MLSVSRIKSAGRAAEYYGKDDYYITGEADAPGLEWAGQGSRALGLAGPARPADFRAVLSGENPDPNGPAISKPDRGAKHHPGWDLTFSAPKSVSVAILVGGDQRLDRAHDRAVDRAMSYAERHLSYTRVRDGGQRREVLTGNLVYATTVHGTSREGDPQRHTHVVVANATLDRSSETWRALESLHLYRHRKLLGKIYQAELAKEARTVGYHVQRQRRDGTYSLDAWSRDQLWVFAKRTQAILETLNIEKPTTPAAKDAVKLKNRPKKIDLPRSELVERWKREAEGAGLDVDRVVREAKVTEYGEDRTPLTWGRVSEAASRVRERVARAFGSDRAADGPYRYRKAQTDRDPQAREAVAYALQLTEVSSAVFSRHTVIERALDAAPSGVGVDRIEADLGRLEHDGRVRTADKSILAGITTVTALDIERNILARMDAGRGASTPLLSRSDVAGQLDRQEASRTGLTLNQGQRAAVHTILTSHDRYVAVQGYAGVGKTTMLSTARAIGEAAGARFAAIAPTHRAAIALQTEASINATTAAAWLVSTTKALKSPLGAKHLRSHWKGRVLIVDEASMISNDQMTSILHAVDKVGIGRVVLVGDDRQLGSPQAGAPFRLLLSRHIDHARMKEIVRQRDPTLRESVRALAQGQAGTALTLVQRHIHEAGRHADDVALARAAVEAAKDSAGPGSDTRIIVPTNALRALVSVMVRDHKVEAGEVSDDSVSRVQYHHIRLDGPERFRATSYELGQRLIFHSAMRGPGIRRGVDAAIVGVDARNDVLRLDTRGGLRSLDLRALGRNGRSPFNAYQVRSNEVAAGDRLVWERADRRRGFLTGEAFTVTERGERFWTIRHADGRVEQLRSDDPALKFTSYAYAETADRAQGQTYKSVVAVLAGRHGEAASIARQYVMQSRPSLGFQLITDERRLLLMKLARQDGLNKIALDSISELLTGGGDRTREREFELGAGPTRERELDVGRTASKPDGKSM